MKQKNQMTIIIILLLGIASLFFFIGGLSLQERESGIVQDDTESITIAEQPVVFSVDDGKDIQESYEEDINSISSFSETIYESMKLPHDAKSIDDTGDYPGFNEYGLQGFVNLIGIGAIYSVKGVQLPDDVEICIGKFSTYVLLDQPEAEWIAAEDVSALNYKHFGIYDLPWYTNRHYMLDEKVTSRNDDYIKISLSSEELDSKVLHFWGSIKEYPSEDIVGIVNIYEVWCTNQNVANKLVADVACDQRDANGKTRQAYWGRKHIITTQKSLVIGHNMPDEIYNWCVKNGKSPEKCLEMFMAENE